MSELRTVFKRVDYDLAGLLHYIEIGDIGLPDIQRPFVWSSAKVRDLFDSMYRGFPVGYLLFWANASVGSTRHIGFGDKAHKAPTLLIVDGQQRLTSLYAVFRGKEVLDENYAKRRIEIAFNPRDGRFEVTDAAIRKDPEFIPDISRLWASGNSSHKLVKFFLKHLSEKKPLTEEEEELISHNLDRLFDLQKYPFTALEISEKVEEEQVADIFVRINSEGVKLNQADFILTLLSVFGEDVRLSFEHFCRQSRVPPTGSKPSSYNHFIQPSPDQLIRVAVAFGFNRARLKYVYQLLRGKDLKTGEVSVALRDVQFKRLGEAQKVVLNTSHWHGFFNALVGSGFRSGDLVSSEIALMYSYALYLFGRERFGVEPHRLDKLMGRWFYAATLTGRYTGTSESVMDSDLTIFSEVKNKDKFVEAMEKIIASSLTKDFWSITLPAELETSSANSPYLMGFHAAQNVLKAPVLFSNKLVADLFDPALQASKKALERHHLFPRAFLESQGFDDRKVINQVGNYALLEWPDNLDISDAPPAKYLPKMRNRFKDKDWERMCRLHALPDGWEKLEYREFLNRRRRLMAEIIREGVEQLE